MTDRRCNKCGNIKGLEHFQKVGGIARLCEDCRRGPREHMRKTSKEVRTAKHKAWRQDNLKHAEYMDVYNLSYHSGVTPEQYQKLVAQQDNLCAICQLPPKEDSRFTRLHVDHCHKTNMIRGLLCTNCNTAIGLLKDNVTFLEAAIKYLKRGGQLSVDLKVRR